MFYQFAAGYRCLRPVSEKKVENESSPGVLSEGITPKSRVIVVMVLLEGRVAELGSLSSGVKMAMKIFVKRVFTIFASNASLLRVIVNLQN